MLELIEFLKNRLGFLLIVFGCLALFAAAVDVQDLHAWKFAPRSELYPIPLTVGGILFLSGIILLFFSDRLSVVPNVAGRWKYEVRDATGEPSHRGELSIAQKGRRLNIHGIRRFTRRSHGSEITFDPVSIPFMSAWAEICSDNVMRVEYHIDLPEQKVESVWKVRIRQRSPQALTGHYYLLPPFDPATLNARFGVALLQKLEGKEPPELHDFDEMNGEHSGPH